MSKTIKTEAIVLKKQELLHNDILLTFFTQVLGKIKVFAKGIKKITSRRLSHAQTGNLIRVLLHENRDYFYLSETQLISGFSSIKNNQKKVQALYCYLFIVERLLPENQKEEEVYKALKSFAIALAKEKEEIHQLLVRHINVLMKHLGYLKDKKSFEELIAIIESLIHEKMPTFTI